MFLPGPPSAQFLLRRVNTSPMRSNLLRPGLVYSLQRLFGVSALQALYTGYHHEQKSSESSVLSDTRNLIGHLNNALDRPVTPSFDICFLAVPWSSPKIYYFIWRLTNALRCRKCALEPIQDASTRTTTASSCSCRSLRLLLRSVPRSLAGV